MDELTLETVRKHRTSRWATWRNAAADIDFLLHEVTTKFDSVVHECCVEAQEQTRRADVAESVSASQTKALTRLRKAVLALHKDNGKGICSECRHKYPCPTAKEVSGA